MEKNYKRQIKKNSELKNKIYVKWKGYNNSFNSWIDKASLVQRT